MKSSQSESANLCTPPANPSRQVQFIVKCWRFLLRNTRATVSELGNLELPSDLTESELADIARVIVFIPAAEQEITK